MALLWSQVPSECNEHTSQTMCIYILKLLASLNNIELTHMHQMLEHVKAKNHFSAADVPVSCLHLFVANQSCEMIGTLTTQQKDEETICRPNPLQASS